jgi:hypothetical protein
VKKTRRRSHQPAVDPVSEPPAEEQTARPSAVGSLSGQLPPGTARGGGRIVTEAGRYLRQAARDEAPARFGSPVSRTVAAAVHEHALFGLPMIDAEMLVRAALGETVPTDEIDAGVLVGVHLLLFASLIDELALGDAELDLLIAQAEESAAPAVV